MKILDCTLRDGGYYTNWDFSKDVLDAYIASMEHLPIDYIEIGYRNNPTVEYLGQFAYCPVKTIKYIRSKYSKGLAVMLNEKSTTPEDARTLLQPLVGLVDLIRLAIDPKNIVRAVKLAETIKEMGFVISFNMMYMSKWKESEDLISNLPLVNKVADIFCMVDSFGGIMPDELSEIISIVKENVTIPLGFHGHNNMELSLANTLRAIDLGVEYIDSTILGMGRGAGNLKTELLLATLNQRGDINIDFNELGDLVSAFTPLYEKYKWGTSLPYMISGAYSIPQKDVMSWVTNRVYSFNSIVRALTNRKNRVIDNAKYPIFQIKEQPRYIVVIGGGESVKAHSEAIKEFINDNHAAIVFATSRYADIFSDVKCSKYYVLVGAEAKRLSHKVSKLSTEEVAILPPYPREMGTDVPEFCKSNTYELEAIRFTDRYTDSCTAVALQVALNFDKSKVVSVGYDGYTGGILSEKEMTLTNENKSLFHSYYRFKGERLISLTPTIYKELNITSIYQYLS